MKAMVDDATELNGFYQPVGAMGEGGAHPLDAGILGLILRGVAAMLEEEEETDASREALREWLPQLEELLRIANLQDAYRAHGYNMVHPALLCARLHGERLGDWAPSVEVATLVELEPFNPYLRTEALRLLSKAKLPSTTPRAMARGG